MKKFIIGFVLGAMLFSGIGVSAAFKYGAFDEINKTEDEIYIDGVKMTETDSNGNPNVAGLSSNWQTFVPLRGVTEQLGITIEWQPGRIDIYTQSPIETDVEVSDKQILVTNIFTDFKKNLITFRFNGSTFIRESDKNNLTVGMSYNITQAIEDKYTNQSGEFIMPVRLEVVGNDGQITILTDE